MTSWLPWHCFFHLGWDIPTIFNQGQIDGLCISKTFQINKQHSWSTKNHVLGDHPSPNRSIIFWCIAAGNDTKIHLYQSFSKKCIPLYVSSHKQTPLNAFRYLAATSRIHEGVSREPLRVVLACEAIIWRIHVNSHPISTGFPVHANWNVWHDDTASAPMYQEQTHPLQVIYTGK